LKKQFIVGFAVIRGYPLPFLILGKQLFLSLVYSVTATGFFMTLMNFMCPLNGVDEKVRGQFLAINPIVAEDWGRFGKRAPKG